MKANQTYFCDVSDIGKIHLSGSSASEFVRVMTTVELERIATPGQAALALVLNAEGNIIDVVMIGRTGEQEYLLITNPQTIDELLEWLQAHAELKDSAQTAVFEDLVIENSTNQIGTVALYGPEAQTVLGELSASDVTSVLSDSNLGLITIGALQLMLIRWPWLSAADPKAASLGEGEVYEVYLPVKAMDDFKHLLLGFVEIDPEDFEDYKEKRRTAQTWFSGAEQAAYVKPESESLQALLRPGMDYVGAKALAELGIITK